MIDSADFERIIATDYPTSSAPGIEVTEYGLVCTWDEKPSLLKARCDATTADGMADFVLQRGITQIKGHDTATLELLRSVLPDWSRGGLVVMIQTSEPTIPANPAVEIETVDPAALAASSSYRRLFEEDDALDAWARHCRTENYRNGEILIGWLNGRPAARAGWYTVNGVARFRTIVTAPSMRGHRVGVSLMHHVLAATQQQDYLAIFSQPPERGGAQALYERMGFSVAGERWKLEV